MESKKVWLTFRGEGVSVSLVDSHKVLCFPREHLCRGLIFEESNHCSISIEVEAHTFLPDFSKVIYRTKEFVAPQEWLSTKRLDWNHCINKWQNTEWACEIEIEGEFDERLVRYNVIQPVSVRVGKKIYQYNQPILKNIDYNGTTYSLFEVIRPITNEKMLDGFEIPQIYIDNDSSCQN
jgi:hypothetical protein